MAVMIRDFTDRQVRWKPPGETSSTVQYPDAAGHDGFTLALIMLVTTRTATIGCFRHSVV